MHLADIFGAILMVLALTQSVLIYTLESGVVLVSTSLKMCSTVPSSLGWNELETA